MVTLDSTFFSFITASKGKQPAEELNYLNVAELTFAKENSQVVVIEASDNKNSQGYVFLVFLDNNNRLKKWSRAIVKHQTPEGRFMWFEL